MCNVAVKVGNYADTNTKTVMRLRLRPDTPVNGYATHYADTRLVWAYALAHGRAVTIQGKPYGDGYKWDWTVE